MSKVQIQSTNVTKITTHKYTMNHAESVILISLGHYYDNVQNIKYEIAMRYTKHLSNKGGAK